MNRKESIEDEIAGLVHMLNSGDLTDEEAFNIECYLDTLSIQLDRIEREEE